MYGSSLFLFGSTGLEPHHPVWSGQHHVGALPNPQNLLAYKNPQVILTHKRALYIIQKGIEIRSSEDIQAPARYPRVARILLAVAGGGWGVRQRDPCLPL